MPTTRRKRTVASAPEAVWTTVGDTARLPSWWPRVQRVEGVVADGFTQVLATDRGRFVRADFRVVEREAPRRVRWSQELTGTPFAKILVRSEIEVALEADGTGTRVTITTEQRLRGVARLGAIMVRRAMRRQLDGALDALEGLHGGA